MNLHPHFHFNSFPEKEREREREREREKREPRSESTDRRAPIDERRDRPTSALVDRPAARSTSSAIVRRAVQSSNEHARRSSPLIAIDRDRRRDRTARRSMSGAIVAARRSARSRSTAGTIGERCDRAVNRDLDNLGAIAPSFFWVCLFLLLLQTPENIF